MEADRDLEALMGRYVAGDLSAYDALYAELAPRVFRYLLHMCRRRDVADDLCQTVFLKLHRSRGGWIRGAPVMPWVMAITRNCLYDESRRRRAQVTFPTDTGDVEDIASSAPEESAAELERAERLDLMSEVVAEALEKLMPLQREALLLTKRSGLSIREAALVIGTTETAVKLRVHRAYLALRAALTAREEKA